MPYVKRDADGAIVAVFREAVEDGLEEIAEDDPELGRFVNSARLLRGVVSEWIETDLAMARVVEDLIDILIERDVIRFTDLPAEAQEKIRGRRRRREEARYVEALDSDTDRALAVAPADDDGGERYL